MTYDLRDQFYGARPHAPGDIIAHIKERLAVVDAKLAEVPALEKEQRKLRDMLEAAGEPFGTDRR